MAAQVFGEAYRGSAAENYDRYFVPAIGAPLAGDLIRRAALRPGERVLDVACGTGVVARLASQEVGSTGSVAGLDVNPGMLAVARTKTPQGASMEWHEASAEAMPLPADAFDVVLCQQSLQFMPNRLAALQEMRRVLVQDGRMLLNVPGPANRPFVILADAMERHIGPAAAGFVRQVFSLHDASELEQVTTDAGFRDVAVETTELALRLPPPREFFWQYVSSTPLAGLVAQADREERDELEREVVAQWQPFSDNGDGMEGTQPVVVVAARK